MGQIISERLAYIGRIDYDGYVFDTSDNLIAVIYKSGYISKPAGNSVLGKIERDGTIRDASMNVIGRIQADGYVYIHSQRVCKVSSAFMERITPAAWNAGQPSTYSGRTNTSTYNHTDTESSSFFSSTFFLKLVLGVIIGIVLMANGVGGLEMLIGGPILVFMFSFFAKLFG